MSISIVDTNNKIPELQFYENNITVYENASDHLIVQLLATDADRDGKKVFLKIKFLFNLLIFIEPHNIIQYYINYRTNPELQRFFEIDESSGLLKVKELDEFNQLDRDNGITEHLIYVNFEDNYGGSGGRKNRLNNSDVN